MTTPPITIALARMLEYESTFLATTVRVLLDETGYSPSPGRTVLVKPNLVNSTNTGISCTDARIVKAVCELLLDNGEKVMVADSPAFGPASAVARATGMEAMLAPIGIRVVSLKDSVKTSLPCGMNAGISRDALKADLIVNLPRLKAHCQMRVTASVKNLFGCVVGFRKAMAHYQLGDRNTLFRQMIMDLPEVLPPVITLLDGIRAMHVSGPIKGKPFHLGLIGASGSAVGLDTAMYSLLGLEQNNVPLWQEAVVRNLPGADPKDLRYPLEKLSAFDATGFEIPDSLDPIRFDPFRVVRGRIRSLAKYIFK